jgi:hypothetical protein
VAAPDLMRRVVGLAAVAALLVAYLLFIDRGPDHPGSGPRTPLLAGFDRTSVRRLSIAPGAGAPFSLERQAPGTDPPWRGSPAGWPADGPAVEGLLTALDFAEIARTADTTPAAAGLAPAAVALTIDGSAGARSLRFGHADAGGGGVFVAIGDEAAVRVAPRHLLDLVERPAEAYRAAEPVAAPVVARDRAGSDGAPPGTGGRPLLDFAHFDVRRLRRTSGAGTVELVSDDGETWRWAPETAPGLAARATNGGRSIDAANATRVASALANLRPEGSLVVAAVRAPLLTWEVDVIPPGQTTAARHRLALVSDQGRGCVGRLDGTTAFRLSPEACDELRLPLVARGAGD